MKTIYIFDFDGVICDSNPETFETSITSFLEIVNRRDFKFKNEKLYNLFLANRYRARRPADFFRLWTSVLENEIKLSEINLGSDFLKEYEYLFFEVRKLERNKDINKWLSKHIIYDGIKDFLLSSMPVEQIFIASTKDESSIKRILRYNNINLNEENIYGSEVYGDKDEMFNLINSSYENCKFKFLDDNELNINMAIEYDFQCYYATWGYGSNKSLDNRHIINLYLDNLSQFI